MGKSHCAYVVCATSLLTLRSYIQSSIILKCILVDVYGLTTVTTLGPPDQGRSLKCDCTCLFNALVWLNYEPTVVTCAQEAIQQFCMILYRDASEIVCARLEADLASHFDDEFTKTFIQRQSHQGADVDAVRDIRWFPVGVVLKVLHAPGVGGSEVCDRAWDGERVRKVRSAVSNSVTRSLKLSNVQPG